MRQEHNWRWRRSRRLCTGWRSLINRHSSNSVNLTSETLKEIPNQLVQYFQQKNIAPLPPLQRSDSTVNIDEVEEEIDLRLNLEEEEIVVVGGGDYWV